MAGPFDIQRPPIGLLDLLGLKATGDNPHVLAGEVRSTLMLDDLFLVDRLVAAARSTGVNIPGTGTATMGAASGPSDGFIWLLYGLDFLVPPVGAAATIQCGLTIQRGTTTTIQQRIEACQSPLLSAGQAFAGAKWWERPLIMRPGDVLAVNTTIFTGAPAVTPTCTQVYVQVSR